MNKDPRRTFYLGSAVEITSIISVATATTAKITILDPILTEKVSAVNMTKQADKVYNYVFQTTTSYLDGLYVAQISIVYGGYTTYYEDTFRLIKQTGD